MIRILETSLAANDGLGIQTYSGPRPEMRAMIFTSKVLV